MNCCECAKVNDTIPALGVCQQCGVGLCLGHLAEIPSVPPMQGVPAGIAAAGRHNRAESAS